MFYTSLARILKEMFVLIYVLLVFRFCNVLIVMYIEQGRLGDCWFLSAVAVLAEVSRISEVIITPDYNEEGIYTVCFCVQVISI